MESVNISWIIVFLGLGAVASELFLGVAAGFDLVLIGSCLVVGGGMGVVAHNWQLGLVVSIIFGLCYLLFGRKLLQSKLHIDAKPSNADSLVGKEGIVTKAIYAKKPGQVKVGSEIWRAESDHTLPVDTHVKVLSIEGVSVRVVELK